MIPESQWEWLGTAGHLIVSRRCQFHLHTHVGRRCISTVGEWHPKDPYDPEIEEVGAGRLYETMVFDLDGGENRWTEIGFEGYNDEQEAERGHMRMCRKYAEEETAC